MRKKKNTYLANREWTKDIKFNNHWYHLTSLFDQDIENVFDFDRALNDVNINFINLAKKSKHKYHKKTNNYLLNDLNDDIIFKYSDNFSL